MPRGDEKHKLIYEALVDVLGPDYVSDDPAVMESFYRDYATMRSVVKENRMEFITLPGNTEDVQQIVRLANRYKFPFSVTSTGLQLTTCGAVEGYPYWCLIDPKRMNRLEIDKKNMCAIVEPYVTHVQLQAEAMKRGLYNNSPGAGQQTSVMANNIWGDGTWTSWRTGGGGRNVLGVEWVLPNGDILRTGSLAIPGGGYCWGEGPGPDARGILRGETPHHGALGIVTRVGVKLFPWPGPPVFPCDGVQPEKRVSLPPRKFKSYFINYPTLEKCIEAIREIGKAEIGGWVMKFAPWDFLMWEAKSREEFWKEWDTGYWQSNIQNMVSIGLWGFASERQVEYEEKVLLDIIRDTGGKLVPEEAFQRLDAWLSAVCVRDCCRPRFLRTGGSFVFAMGSTSLDDTLRAFSVAWEFEDKYCPPVGGSVKYLSFFH